MRARNLVSLAVLVVAGACSDAPKKDVPPPGAAGKPPNPLITDEPRATPAESSPVPSNARTILEEYVRGGLDPRATTLALERILTETKDVPMKAGADWTTSTRRALTHALITTPRELKNELRRYQDERSRFETASVTSDLKANRYSRVIALADRYPNAGFAQSLWLRLAKERATAPRELVDASVLTAPVPTGGMRMGGISIKANGDDALVASDADGTAIWEHRARGPAGETPSLRVLGTFLDQLVVLEQKKSGVDLELIDLATGNTLSRVSLPDAKAPHVALVGSDVIVATPRRVVLVDLLRGVVGWERAHTFNLPVSIAEDRVVLESSGIGLDLSTGRFVEGAAGKPRRQGSVEVR